MSKPFYRNGLRFECTMCHACCRYEPGYVFLSERDLLRLCEGLKLSRDEVLRRYCREVTVGGVRLISLTEKENYDCIFWDGGCTIYPHRPLQCRSYPFWSANLASHESWNLAGARCPGVNHGKLHTQEEIDTWLAMREQDPPITL